MSGLLNGASPKSQHRHVQFVRTGSPRATPRPSTPARSSTVPQPELALIKQDVKLAEKFGDMAVEAFDINPRFVKQKIPSWTDFLLIAQSKRRKSKYKPIWVPHPDDVAQGIYPEHHIIKGSGETFLSALAKGQRAMPQQPEVTQTSDSKLARARPMSAAAKRVQSRSSTPTKRPQSAASRLGPNPKSILESPVVIKKTKRKKYKSDGGFGGLRMSLVASRTYSSVYGNKKDEDQGVSDSESDTTDSEALGQVEDSVTDYSRLIDEIHLKGAKSEPKKFCYKEDKSNQVVDNYSGSRTLHLHKLTGTKDKTDIDKSKTKTINMGYFRSNVLYNARLMSRDSVRTEVLRNQPRRRQISTVEKRLKQMRTPGSRDHSTTYYDGREWLMVKEKREEKQRKEAEAERKKKEEERRAKIRQQLKASSTDTVEGTES